MTYKDMFDQAFDSLGNSKMRMTDSEFSAAVRAKAKKNTVVVGNGMTLREIPVSREPHSQHKLRNAVFGIAGTAAVLTGAVFGLKFLNEHGGLKEGGGAASETGISAPEATAIVATMVAPEGEEFIPPTMDIPDPETLPDIHEAIGKTLVFHDATMRLAGVSYDGKTLGAMFNVLYTGDDSDNYSPMYAKIDIGYTLTNGEIEYINDDDPDDAYLCTFTEVPEADSYTHVCTFSVPIELEPDKAYSATIIYFNPNNEGQNGSSTQPIEADKQRYSFTYHENIIPEGTKYEFENCTVEPKWYTYDGMTLNISYDITYKGEIPDFPSDTGIYLTTSDIYDGLAGGNVGDIRDGKRTVRTKVMLNSIKDPCELTFSDGRQSYKFTAELPQNANVLNAETNSRVTLDDGNNIYIKRINASKTAVSFLCDADRRSDPPDVTIRLKNGTEIHEDMKASWAEPILRDVWLRYQFNGVDPKNIAKIYFGNSLVYGTGTIAAPSENEISEKALTCAMNQEIMFSPVGTDSDICGAQVKFTDYYFDKAKLVLHYDVTYAGGIPDKVKNGEVRNGVEIGDGYRCELIGIRQLSETEDTVSFEAGYRFFERYNEVTVKFYDTELETAGRIPFTLKCPENAANSIIINSEPKARTASCIDPQYSDYEFKIGDTTAAILDEITVCPSGLILRYWSDFESYYDLSYNMSLHTEPYVVLKNGKEVLLDNAGFCTTQVLDDTARTIVKFNEVVDPEQIRSIYLGGVCVYLNGEPPINGNGMNATYFRVGDYTVATDGIEYDGLRCTINYTVQLTEGKEPDGGSVPGNIAPVFCCEGNADRGYYGSAPVNGLGIEGYRSATLITLKPMPCFEITFSDGTNIADGYMLIRKGKDCISELSTPMAPIVVSELGEGASLNAVYISDSTAELVYEGTEFTKDNMPPVRVLLKNGTEVKLKADDHELLNNSKTGEQYQRFVFEKPMSDTDHKRGIGMIDKVYVYDTLVYVRSEE